MTTIIIGPVAANKITTVFPAVIQLKQRWTDEWQLAPEMELQNCSKNASAHDLDTCHFARRYGNVKYPFESSFSQKTPLDLTGWWVRVGFAGDQGYVPQWIGRVYGEGRDVHGAQNGPSGRQMFEAYGPMQMLRKIFISQSYWQVTGKSLRQKMDWVPGVNERNKRGGLVGNRSHTKLAGTYQYGGNDLWSHAEYLDYLIYQFLDWETGGLVESGSPTGPSWHLTGQKDILQQITESVSWHHPTLTAAEMIRQLIPLSMGVDFRIEPADDGFDIRVYALSDRDWTVENSTIQKNPDTVSIYSNRTIDNLRTRVAKTADHQYNKIRMLGNLVTMCCSFYGDNWTDPLHGNAHYTDLRGQWPATLPAKYDNPSGNAGDSKDFKDSLRCGEFFRPIFQSYAITPDWDFHNGRAAPLIKNGKIVDGVADHQNVVHGTLPWLPMREGFDYSKGSSSELMNGRIYRHSASTGMFFQMNGQPADGDYVDVAWDGGARLNMLVSEPNSVDFFIAGGSGDDLPGKDTGMGTSKDHGITGTASVRYDTPDELCKPQVWLKDEAGFYNPCDFLEISLHVSQTTIGFFLKAAIPHILAKGFFTGYPDNSYTHPIYDPRDMVATLAFPSSTRLTAELDNPTPTDLGGTLELSCTDAEMWILEPSVVLDLNPTRQTGSAGLKYSPNTPTIVRNDYPRLCLKLAGAAARYFGVRTRAEITVQGYRPWGGLVGQILDTLDDGADAHAVKSVITSVVWQGGDHPTTTIYTGFAKGN